MPTKIISNELRFNQEFNASKVMNKMLQTGVLAAVFPIVR